MTAPPQTLADQKVALRREMMALRGNLPARDRVEAAQSVRLHFSDHPYLTYAKSFAGYYAIHGEIDVLPIFNHMLRFQKQMALPRIHGELLQFHLWQPGQPLETTQYNLKVPPAMTHHFVPEVVLVPLLAFDAHGHRLGYGGGYYDRTMELLRRSRPQPPLFIGVAYGMQERERLPAEAHDARLDGILTENGVSLFS